MGLNRVAAEENGRVFGVIGFGGFREGELDSSGDYEIRKISPGRWLAQMDRVLKAAYRKEAELLGLTSFPPLDRTPEDILACENSFFGCINSRELCGVVELEYSTVNDRKQTTIASLAVAPTHFRRGIATNLVRFVLECSAERVFVTTGAANEPAIRLYEGLGFAPAWRFVTPEGVQMVAYLRKRDVLAGGG